MMKLLIIFFIIVILLVVYASMTSNWLIIIITGAVFLTVLLIKLITLKARTVIITNFNPRKEYIIIKNVSNKPIIMTNWKIKDNNNNIYNFEKDLTLKKGETIQIQSGDKNAIKKHLDDITYYIDAWRKNIWDDAGDIAYLINDKGKIITKKKAKATY